MHWKAYGSFCGSISYISKPETIHLSHASIQIPSWCFCYASALPKQCIFYLRVIYTMFFGCTNTILGMCRWHFLVHFCLVQETNTVFMPLILPSAKWVFSYLKVRLVQFSPFTYFFLVGDMHHMCENMMFKCLYSVFNAFLSLFCD